MKKWLCMILTVMLMAGGIVSGALAKEREQGFYKYYVKTDGTIEIMKVSTDCTDEAIPGEFDGIPVTSIGNFAYEDCTKIKKIVIPDTVTSIGENAFWGCKGITEVTIPDNLSAIGDNFLSHANVKTVNISREHPHLAYNNGALIRKQDMTLIRFFGIKGNEYDVGWGIRKIAPFAFRGAKLQTINLPDTVTSIGNQAFLDCTALKNIYIPGSLTRIDSLAFGQCKGLKTVSFPAGLTEIGDRIFDGCDNLKEVLIAEDNPAFEVRGNAVINKETKEMICVFGLKNGACVIPEGVQRIKEFAFSGMKITSVILPEGLRTIPICAFNYCTNLKEAVIPTGVTSIARGAFTGCKNLTKVVIPATVIDIDSTAFDGCSKLTCVVTKDSCAERFCKILKIKYTVAE